jgi:hypothetical protein
MVRSIRARLNRKTGRVAITFEIDRQTWANRRRSAQDAEYPDRLGYITGSINTAFLEDWADPPPDESPLGKATNRLVPFLAMTEGDDRLGGEERVFLIDLVERWTARRDITPAELCRAEAIMVRVEAQGGGDLNDEIPF